MKIVQIATNLKGGAGVAAVSLNEELSRSSIDSQILSRDLLDGGSSPLRTSYFSILSKLNTLSNELVTTESYAFTSARSIAVLDPSRILELKPDIVHIHNWYNLLSLEGLLELTSTTRVVFTLHDTRLLTGGCHAFRDCSNYNNQCKSCPAVKKFQKRIHSSKLQTDQLFANSRNIQVITPSLWLGKEFSRIHKYTKVTTIPNLISKNYFRQVLRVPRNSKKRKLLFIASEINSVYKGGKLLADAMMLLGNSRMSDFLSLTVVGSGPRDIFEQLQIEVNYLGNVSSRVVQEIMDDHDLVVVPSLFDNFPTVVIESQLSGIPVVGTRVGGISELISDFETGFLCEPEAKSLADKILQAFDSDLASISARALEVSRSKFETSTLLNLHLDTYSELIENA